MGIKSDDKEKEVEKEEEEEEKVNQVVEEEKYKFEYQSRKIDARRKSHIKKRQKMSKADFHVGNEVRKQKGRNYPQSSKVTFKSTTTTTNQINDNSTISPPVIIRQPPQRRQSWYDDEFVTGNNDGKSKYGYKSYRLRRRQKQRTPTRKVKTIKKVNRGDSHDGADDSDVEEEHHHHYYYNTNNNTSSPTTNAHTSAFFNTEHLYSPPNGRNGSNGRLIKKNIYLWSSDDYNYITDASYQ